MKYIITETQHQRLKEQILNDKLTPLHLASWIASMSEKFGYFVDRIKPDVERRAKNNFPTNEKVSKDPNFKKTPEYRELKDKEDAFAHQLASAVATSMFGSEFSDILGKLNEIKGGLRMFLKGSPSKGIERFEQFTSGWTEDNENNKIGIEIGEKYPNRNLDFYSNEVLKNIQVKNYYDSTGRKKS